MTRKRFIKLMMALGYSKRYSVALAWWANKMEFEYKHMSLAERRLVSKYGIDESDLGILKSNLTIS